MRIITLEETDSTNSYMQVHAAEMAHGDVVRARRQMAGRGQRGNSWESAPEANVTMSIFLRPMGLGVAESFPLSEAVAIGVCDTLTALLDEELRSEVAVKWPNDIYVGDKKIAGILIENSLRGAMIDRSIAGIGLNINQKEFVSDAPNPVSVAQLTGRQNDVAAVAESLAVNILKALELMSADSSSLHRRYMSLLWRGSGLHPFIEAATGRRFEASVEGVAPSGYITLREHLSGNLSVFAFKEIIWG